MKKWSKLKIFNELKSRNEEMFKIWEQLTDIYSRILNEGPSFGEISFTPHNFDNHCMNIYKILDKMLKEEFYQSSSNGINIFLLVVAVLFHDYCMTEENTLKARDTHSKDAAQWFLNQYEMECETSISNLIPKNYAQCISMIIKAHSDVKGSEPEKTLVSLMKKYNEPINYVELESEKINVAFLGALMRFADELDITKERLFGTNYKRQKILEASNEHFNKLLLFQDVRFTEDGTTLSLVIDRSSKIFECYKYHQIVIWILEVYDKVNDCYKEIRELLDDYTSIKTPGFNVRKVILHEPEAGLSNNPYEILEKYREIKKKGTC